jgi:hypothetical protein
MSSRAPPSQRKTRGWLGEFPHEGEQCLTVWAKLPRIATASSGTSFALASS